MRRKEEEGGGGGGVGGGGGGGRRERQRDRESGSEAEVAGERKTLEKKTQREIVSGMEEGRVGGRCIGGGWVSRV